MNLKLHLCLLNSVIIILTSLAVLISCLNFVYGQDLSSNDNSLSPEFMSDLNFTNFSKFDSSTDFELPEFYFPDINGTYIDSDIGFQVDLPKDWKGKEIKFMMNMVFVSPQEINLEDIEEPGTFITISALDQEYFNILTDLSPLSGLEELAGQELTEDEGSLQGNELLDKPTSNSNIDSCSDFPISSVTINGINAEQLMADCTDEQGANTKTKVYAFATSDDSIILIGFYSNSHKEYNQYLPLFEESVKTIKISNPGDIAKSETYKKYKELELQSNKTVS